MIELFVGDKPVSERRVSEKSMVEAIKAFLGRTHKAISQATCRHDYYWGRAPGRLFLRCSKCQRETPGWDLSDIKPPTDRSK